MECGWATLQRQIQRAESLDEMVEAHHQFLDTLIARLNFPGPKQISQTLYLMKDVEFESYTGLCLTSDHGSYSPNCGPSMTGY